METTENNVQVEENKIEVAEPTHFSSAEEFRKKFMPGYWKTKEVDGVSTFIKMDDMGIHDKLRALKVAERQAAKYAKLQEVHLTKYEELLDSLSSIDGMDEWQALEAIKVVSIK